MKNQKWHSGLAKLGSRVCGYCGNFEGDIREQKWQLHSSQHLISCIGAANLRFDPHGADCLAGSRYESFFVAGWQMIECAWRKRNTAGRSPACPGCLSQLVGDWSERRAGARVWRAEVVQDAAARKFPKACKMPRQNFRTGHWGHVAAILRFRRLRRFLLRCDIRFNRFSDQFDVPKMASALAIGFGVAAAAFFVCGLLPEPLATGLKVQMMLTICRAELASLLFVGPVAEQMRWVAHSTRVDSRPR